MTETLRSAIALVALLNPFLLSVYLLELIRDLTKAQLGRVLLRAGLISGTVFAGFALTGDALFREVLQVRLASFLLFGGIIWLIIGVRFVLEGSVAVAGLRGPPQRVAGAVAMPFMIGPGTVSGSILAGAQQAAGWAVLSTSLAVVTTMLVVYLFKVLHDHVATRHVGLTERYVDIVGRLSSLVVGTFAVELLLQGADLYLTR